MKTTRQTMARLLAAFMLAAFCATAAHARVLKLDRLEPSAAAQLSREAQAEYERALTSLDRILYEKAMPELLAALQLAPEEEHLRFMVVQLAAYLGDTRWSTNPQEIRGPDTQTSQDYYKIAIDNLNILAQSPRLNLREQERARQGSERMTALMNTVYERDAARRQWGLGVAKEWRAELEASRAAEATAPAGGSAAGGGIQGLVGGSLPSGNLSVQGTGASLTMGSLSGNRGPGTTTFLPNIDGTGQQGSTYAITR